MKNGKMRVRQPLAVKVFSLILIFVVLPSALIMSYMSYRYENYIRTTLSDRTIQELQKSEEDIIRLFQRMVNISSVVANDETLIRALQDPAMSRYDKTICFDQVVRTIEANNLYDMNGVRITLFDRSEQVYANWSTNYHDYRFLFEQDWVQRSIAAKGFVTWNLFAPSYVIEENEQVNYISLARSIQPVSGGERVATEIISIPQDQLSAALRQYFYSDDDFIYIETEDGHTALKLDDRNILGEQAAAQQIAQNGADKSGSRLVTLQGERYLMSWYSLSRQWSFEGETLEVMQFTAYDNITEQMTAISRQLNGWLLGSVAAMLVLIVLITRAIVRPIETLSRKMEGYRLEETPEGLDYRRSDEIGQLNRSFRQMSQTIRELFEKERKDAQEREKYRFEALRAQVNPHFLFNTLNMIRWMAIIRHADNIVDSIDALATMLRYSMSRGGELVHLRQEIENIRSYLYIQNCRYGDRITLETDLDAETLELPVVKFILQPIVENAVMHGFKGSEKAGRILVYGDREDGILHLFVEDNGVGIPEERLHDVVQKHRDPSKVTGIGIANVDERIRSAYGEAYGLSVHSTPGSGTVVEYRLPLMEGVKIDEEVTDRR